MLQFCEAPFLSHCLGELVGEELVSLVSDYVFEPVVFCRIGSNLPSLPPKPMVKIREPVGSIEESEDVISLLKAPGYFSHVTIKQVCLLILTHTECI